MLNLARIPRGVTMSCYVQGPAGSLRGLRGVRSSGVGGPRYIHTMKTYNKHICTYGSPFVFWLRFSPVVCNELVIEARLAQGTYMHTCIHTYINQ